MSVSECCLQTILTRKHHRQRAGTVAEEVALPPVCAACGCECATVRVPAAEQREAANG